MDTNKPKRLLYKLLAGLIYTDIELRPKHELERYAEHICETIGEVVNGKRLIANLIKHEIITLEHIDKDIEYYICNLPKTLSHGFKIYKQADKDREAEEEIHYPQCSVHPSTRASHERPRRTMGLEKKGMEARKGNRRL